MWSCLQSANGVFFVNNLACSEENTFNPVFTGKRRIRQQGLIISDLQKLLFGCPWSKTFPSHCFIFKAGGKTEAPRHAQPLQNPGMEQHRSAPILTALVRAAHAMLYHLWSFPPHLPCFSAFSPFSSCTHINLPTQANSPRPLSKR